MTAINLFVQREAAYLVTDGAYYERDGTLVELRTKVTAAADLRMAIAGSGCVKNTHVANAIGKVDTQAAVLARLPSAVASIRDANRAANPSGELDGTNDLMLFVAMWSDERRRAEGYVIASDRSYLCGGYVPGTLFDVLQLSSPPLPHLDLATLDVPARAAAMLQDQREQRDAHPRPGCWIGGFGELATATAEGVTIKRVCEWPDRISERINCRTIPAPH